MDDLVIIADALTRRRDPVTSLSVLKAMLPERWRGVVRARTALTLARERTDSVYETITRLLLVRAGLPCPLVNLEILLPDGRNFLDMAYEEAMVAVEYNGAVHVGDQSQMESDEKRRRQLEDMGWRIITVTRADIYNRPASIVRSVRNALGRRAA